MSMIIFIVIIIIILYHDDCEYVHNHYGHPCTYYIYVIIIFLAWMADHKYDVAFATMQPEELAEYLRRFYGDLASSVGSGEEYNKSSLINIRAGLNRHVTSLRGICK